MSVGLRKLFESWIDLVEKVEEKEDGEVVRWMMLGYLWYWNSNKQNEVNIQNLERNDVILV